MTAPHPVYDPQHPAHRTRLAWLDYGNLGWFGNAFVYAVQHGESRILLHRGVVLVLFWEEPSRSVQVEEVLL